MEVRVNGILIDSTDSVIAISKQGFDFSDLKKRFLGRTNQFSLPRTAKNNEVFKSPRIINTSADSFEVLYNVTVEDQGVTILKGVGILDSAGDTYKLQVVDSAKSLFDSLEADLRDLDLSSSDFEFTLANYEILKQYSGNTTCWIWPFDIQHVSNIDVIAKTTAHPSIKYSRPHFNGLSLVTAMLEEKDWTLDIPSSIELDLSAISSNHKNFYVRGYVAQLTYILSGGGTQQMLDYTANSLFIAPTVFSSSFYLRNIPIENRFKLRGSIVATSDFTIEITSTSYPLGSDVVVSTFFISETDTEIDFTTDVFKTDEAENWITAKATGTGTLDLTGVLFYSIIEEDAFGDLSGGTANVGVLENYLVTAYDNMPDMSQLELLKELWTLFPFNFNINQNTKTIEAYSIEISRANSVDWSDKFIKDSETVSLSDASLGKTTLLRFNNDEFISEGTSGASFAVDNNTLPAKEIYLQSAFSGSETIDLSVSLTHPVIKMPIYNDTERENSLTVRVHKIKEVTDDWATEATVIPIDWSTQKNEAYKTIFEALQKGRAIEAYFNLTKLDVVSIDFSKSIYIEQFKSYFILSSISNYMPGRLTKCEILKIN